MTKDCFNCKNRDCKTDYGTNSPCNNCEKPDFDKLSLEQIKRVNKSEFYLSWQAENE